jgi:hypothetical protein
MVFAENNHAVTGVQAESPFSDLQHADELQNV